MKSMLQVSIGLPKTVLTSLFSRSFSFYRAFQQPYKESYAELRLNNPEAYKRRLDKSRAYYEKMRQNPDAWRKRLDQNTPHVDRWRRNPDNKAKKRATMERFWDAHGEDERRKSYSRLKNWCGRYAWVREQLPLEDVSAYPSRRHGRASLQRLQLDKARRQEVVVEEIRGITRSRL